MVSNQLGSLLYKSNWIQKFIETYLAILFALSSITLLVELLPIEFFTRIIQKIFSFFIIFEETGGILVALVFSVYWLGKEKNGKINSELVKTWFRAVIRYGLAFSISTYGFAKILKTQFASDYSRSDTLVGDLNGIELTWNYFSHSYAFAVIIAVCQIGGSILLLFRRTTLLGTIILLPVMINIFLINIFYEISFAAFILSLIYLLGLFYLLLLNHKQLKLLFFHLDSSRTNVNLGFLKYPIKFVPIGLAFGLIYILSPNSKNDPLCGKWRVDQYIRNDKALNKDAWISDPSDWKNVYIEKDGSLILSPNPMFLDKSRALFNDYVYDNNKHSIKLLPWNNPKKDTLNIAVSKFDESSMQWKLVYQKDTLLLYLSKAK